ncbi:MAG: hypothetical protein EXR58_03060 [Chloroflexi bacterium]|nr:hypothetical protein [Chloroflexota bacterium]
MTRESKPGQSLLRRIAPFLMLATFVVACSPAASPTSVGGTGGPAAPARTGPKEIAIPMQTSWPWILQYGRITAITGPGALLDFP